MNSIRCGLLAAAALCVMISPAPAEELPLWQLYESTFKTAKYIDLTHAFEPVQPVWPGFGPAAFRPATAGRNLGDFAKAGDEFTYEKHGRSEEHTSELQSLMRISYAVFCLKKHITKCEQPH